MMFGFVVSAITSAVNKPHSAKLIDIAMTWCFIIVVQSFSFPPRTGSSWPAASYKAPPDARRHTPTPHRSLSDLRETGGMDIRPALAAVLQ